MSQRWLESQQMSFQLFLFFLFFAFFVFFFFFSLVRVCGAHPDPHIYSLSATLGGLVS
jgi:hypothetical protein